MKISTVTIRITNVNQVWRALAIPNLSKHVRSQLLGLMAQEGDWKSARKVLNKNLCNDLPGEAQLKAAFAAILSLKELPQDLLAALSANPKGELRRVILGKILGKASTSMKALESGARLTIAEKKALVERVLTTNNSTYRARYALAVLELKLGFDELRPRLVKNVCGDWSETRTLLESPHNYFREDAPLSTEERRLLVQAYTRWHSASVNMLKNFGQGYGAQFSEDELKEAIPKALEYLRSVSYDVRHEVEFLLGGNDGCKAITLFSEDQKKQFQGLLEKKAA